MNKQEIIKATRTHMVAALLNTLPEGQTLYLPTPWALLDLVFRITRVPGGYTVVCSVDDYDVYDRKAAGVMSAEEVVEYLADCLEEDRV